jgi:hypothetical protein
VVSEIDVRAATCRLISPDTPAASARSNRPGGAPTDPGVFMQLIIDILIFRDEGVRRGIAQGLCPWSVMDG